MNRISGRKQIRRFTLLEMLMAMGLLSLIMYSLLSMLGQTQKAMSIGISKINGSEDARLVLNMIESDLQCIDFNTAESMGMQQGAVNSPERNQVLFLGDGTKTDHDGDIILISMCCTREGTGGQFGKVVYAVRDTDEEPNRLIMKQAVWDSKNYRNPSNGDPDGTPGSTGGWDWEDEPAVLLTNLAFDNNKPLAKVEGISGPGGDKYKGHYAKISVALALMDEYTVQRGTTYSVKNGKVVSTFSRSSLEKKMDDDAVKARLMRFTRTMFIDLSEL